MEDLFLVNFDDFPLKDTKISDVKISLGMTLGGGANVWPPSLKREEKDGKMQYKNSSFLFFSAEKIFIHPKLGSAEVSIKYMSVKMLQKNKSVINIYSRAGCPSIFWIIVVVTKSVCVSVCVSV